MWPFTRKATYEQVQRQTDLLLKVQTQLNRMGAQMADVTDLLNELASDIDTLATPLDEVLAELADAKAQLAAQSGEEASESEAVTRVRESFNRIADKFTQEPSTPDVDPLPDASPVVDETNF
jgi:methyl-accepting chemotaxis protein